MGGGDMSRHSLAGIRLIDRAMARLAPQVGRVVVSANGNADGLPPPGMPVVEDGAAAGRGPLSGILAGLRWTAAEMGGDAMLVSVPADTPFLPLGLVPRLLEARRNGSAEIAVAASAGRIHHAVAAWPAGLADALEDWLQSQENSAVRLFLAARRTVTVDFAAPYDPFFNVNTPEDLEMARRIEQEFSP
jgi:molybdopterin-guanine dinucleotide biosynthesis protein A